MIKTRVFGKIVKQYKVPINEIKDLNNRYEEVEKDLKSFGSKLAGRLDSELQFTKILESTEAYSTIVKCIDDYITDSVKFDILDQGGPLEILSCWINDMKPGEYNPPHTHHNLSGYSTVLFLKVPEFINDVKDPQHCVMPFKSVNNELRRSMSFNFIFKL